MKITVYKTNTCAYCPQTIKYLDNHQAPYQLVDITYNVELANQVAKASHTTKVPLVTTAESLEDLTHENFYTGWNIRKLNEFIRQAKGE
jgi:glutaredoxin